MDKKTKGLIFTIVTAVIFGFPGLFLVGMALIIILSADAAAELHGDYAATIVFFIFGLILISLPIFVGYFTLRAPPKAFAESAPQPDPES